MPEVEYTNWFSRMGKSFGSVVVGLIMFVVSFPLLIWNEGNAVYAAQTLKQGAAECISPSLDKVDEANEGKLIYVAGKATSSDTVTDPQFGVSVKALGLKRTGEIYQWYQTTKEEKKKDVIGGGEKTTTYYYHEKKWMTAPNTQEMHKSDSEGPIKGTIPQNQGTIPYSNATEVAQDPKLGAYKLTKAQVEKMKTTPQPITKDDLKNVPAETPEKKKLTVQNGAFYLPFASSSASDTSTEPQIGDVRVTFTKIEPQDVSVIAKQFKGSFEPWQAKTGRTIDLLDQGIKSKEAMFAEQESMNTTLTWILRLVGFVLMALGIYLVFSPLVTFAELLPFLGGLLGAGVAIVAILIALPLTLITIAVSWVAYRPLIGIPLLVVGIALIVGIVVMGRRRSAKAAPGAPPGAPPGPPPGGQYREPRPEDYRRR
jgi:hypothetical protein